MLNSCTSPLYTSSRIEVSHEIIIQHIAITVGRIIDFFQYIQMSAGEWAHILLMLWFPWRASAVKSGWRRWERRLQRKKGGASRRAECWLVFLILTYTGISPSTTSPSFPSLLAAMSYDVRYTGAWKRSLLSVVAQTWSSEDRIVACGQYSERKAI